MRARVRACGRAGARAGACVRGRVRVCLHVCLICAVHSGHLKETSEYWLLLKNLASPAAKQPVPRHASELAASWELPPPGTVVATGWIDLGGVDVAIAALVCAYRCKCERGPRLDARGVCRSHRLRSRSHGLGGAGAPRSDCALAPALQP